MNNLLSSSFLSLVLMSCHYGHYRKLHPVGVSTRDSIASLTPLFKDTSKSFLYKSNMTLYGKSFGGLMLFKRIEQEEYRVVFTTEIGMTLFDFGFKDTSFKVYRAIPQFENPRVLEILRKDLGNVIMDELSRPATQVLSDKQGSYRVYKYDLDKGQDYYFQNSGTNNLDKLEYARGNRVKIRYEFDNYVDKIPGSISIKHFDIGLRITMELLKR